MEFVPERASKEEWARYHIFRRARHEESEPGDPIDPDEVVETQLRRPPEFSERAIHVWRDGDQVTGNVRTHRSRPGAPDYEKNGYLAWLQIEVLAPYRRRGLGRQGLLLGARQAEAWGSRVLNFDTHEPDGHAFLQAVGAEKRFQAIESRLSLETLDWALMRRWVEDGERRAPDTRLDLYDGHLPEELFDWYTPALTAMLNTIPLEDLDFGGFAHTSDVQRDQYARMDEIGGLQELLLAVEPDNSISGMTELYYEPHQPTSVWQGLTAVREDARGRGLGRRLKAAMVEHLRQRFPSVASIRTDNANSNAHMLAINREMGFKEHRVVAEYQMGVAAALGADR